MATAPSDTNFCNKIVETCDDAGTGQPRGSFRAQANPMASIGVAKMAAALALAALGPMHTSSITEHSYVVFPVSIQSQSWATPQTALDGAVLAKAPATRTAAPLDDLHGEAGRTAAPASRTLPIASVAVKPTVTADANKQTTVAAADMGLNSKMAASKVASQVPDVHPAASATANADAVSGAIASGGIPALTSAAATDAAGDYLPAALRSLVPTSVADYWRGVDAATRDGMLHATLYVSPKAWTQVAPTIAGMLGARGTGPAGQVRFALVPLTADYTARAAAAAAAAARRPAPTAGGGALAAAMDGNGDDGGDDLAERYGLDVALAAVALAAPGARGGGCCKPLEVCPAMVVRGGYTRSARPIGGEVIPAWIMRQDLDEHVRRNLQYSQQLLLQPQPLPQELQAERPQEAMTEQQQQQQQQGHMAVERQQQKQQQAEPRRRVEQFVASLALWGAWAGGREERRQQLAFSGLRA